MLVDTKIYEERIKKLEVSNGVLQEALKLVAADVDRLNQAGKKTAEALGQVCDYLQKHK